VESILATCIDSTIVIYIRLAFEMYMYVTSLHVLIHVFNVQRILDGLGVSFRVRHEASIAYTP
jgi:hypothetical protein